MAYDGTDAPLTQIPKDYWLGGDFDPLHCLIEDAPSGCCTQPDAGVDELNITVYQDVQVNKFKIENKWPRRGRNGTRIARALNIGQFYAEAVDLRNHAVSLRVLDAATESKMDELQCKLVEEIRKLAPERSINLDTLNQFDIGQLPPTVLQDPKRTLEFSELLRRVMNILEDYK